MCNIIARKTINCKSFLSVEAAAPSAIPSAAAWTTSPIVAVCVFDFGEPTLLTFSSSGLYLFSLVIKSEKKKLHPSFLRTLSNAWVGLLLKP